MFSVSDLLLINKIDYLSLSDFDKGALSKNVMNLNPSMGILEISCKTGLGIEAWINWLKIEIASFSTRIFASNLPLTPRR